MSLITLKNVKKEYGKNQLLFENLSLEIEKGDQSKEEELRKAIFDPFIKFVDSQSRIEDCSGDRTINIDISSNPMVTEQESG